MLHSHWLPPPARKVEAPSRVKIYLLPTGAYVSTDPDANVCLES
jgi:hypothetical protein